MDDRELYRQILGINEPWRVARVELARAAGEIHVHLEHDAQASWACPECGAACALYDHQAERRWRHLDTCQFRTILHAQPPRSNCPEHGPRVVSLPWAEPGSRFTALFESLAISWLREASQQGVAELLALSWDEVHGILERAVGRGLERRQAEPVPRLGVDEKSFRKRHRYLTVVNDLDRGRVLYVAEGRRQASLDGFWERLTAEQRDSIEAVAMDMWDPYVASTRQHLGDADQKIVYDKFHIAQHLAKAVDQVRRAENKRLRAAGDERLTGTKYQWLRHPARFSKEAWREFRTLREADLKTARAWALKESLMRLFDYRYVGAARRFFEMWSGWASRCRLEPMLQVARMLRARLDNVLTYLKHGVTNAVSEGLNSRIQWVKATARGFRNQQNFINAIYFHCGGLDLDPKAATH
jgi:transposase